MVLEQRRVGSTAILTLNRPEQRNALNPELIAALSAALGRAGSDDGVRSVILTGTGDRAFCAGMDLKAFAANDIGSDAADAANIFESLLGGLDKPVIAAVNAAAVAGGFELVLACDLVVASETAVFGLPEVKRGLFAGGGGYTLPARIPLTVALELGLTGDPIDARRALALGLVNQVVPPERVLGAAQDYATRIGANGPLGVAATKKTMRLVGGGDPAGADDLARNSLRRVFGSRDAAEGARAFAEKRSPVWTGR
ncbi:enoyl-CoA hydratase-related protein [Nakamurella lactea]|uniref:enoyl-CoA hydratase-related protein n=1 Tax=Nakamurella lactea TaxID=459515 RepID=UPI0003FEF027|nr:enoyl-CoA hydratase-related protein [Nakamurella lactea]